jgi:predicted nucleic acid-binding protein
MFVLDAWAILALLQREEPAASRVKALLDEAYQDQADLYISMINLGEVLYRVGKVTGEDEAWETLRQLRSLPVTVLPADEKAVLAAVTFKMRHPLSYADAFAAAATQELDATLLTGDPELLALSRLLKIEKLERR